MDYSAAINYLLSFADLERAGGIGRAGETFDLARMRALLDRLDSPERGCRTVHVAGSKGKSSTAIMTEAILRAAGLRTGLFTSPHLHSYCERVVVNGSPIEEQAFADIIAELSPVAKAMTAGGMRPTTFELLTALGFVAFRNAAVDVQVIEVGLGGRLDATNVLDEKDVCAITPIGLEHTDILGPDLRSIATEKAGIVREGVPTVMGLQPLPAAEVIRAVCATAGSELHEVASECGARRTRANEGQSFQLRTPAGSYTIDLPLAGRHQMENAIVTVRTAELFLQRAGLPLATSAVRTGLAGLRIPGRLESIGRRPKVIFDAAHTTESAQRLVQALREDFGIQRAVVVIGMSSDKDAVKMARVLAPIATTVIATRSEHPRAADPQALARAFSDEGCDAAIDLNAETALDEARTLAGENGVVLVTGSFYLVGALRARLLGLGAHDLALRS